jgi:hypothetical protein
MNLQKIKLGNFLIGAGAGTALLAVVAGNNNLEASNPDLSSLEAATTIQYQTMSELSNSEKICYDTTINSSLKQFASVTSDEKAHNLAIKKCGISSKL